MLQAQRDALILALLQQEPSVTIADICSHCGCSAMTARRDLSRLDEQGLLRRTHGGAVALPASPERARRSFQSTATDARLALLDRSDVLIVTPSGGATIHLLTERARRAGVPIIAESIGYPGATTVVAIDDYRAGTELAYWVGEYVQRNFGGQARILDVTSALPNTILRSRGFADGIRQMLPDAQVILSVDGQGLRDEARRTTADAFALYPDINVVFGINDDSVLGALDSHRAAGLSDRNLLAVGFGFEGDASRRLLSQGNGPFLASVAMFPELVGRVCVQAAVCAYHRHALPGRIMTPYQIVTPASFDRFYHWDPQTGSSVINWRTVESLPTANAAFRLLGQCIDSGQPGRIGWVQVFSSHDWYRNIRRTMQEHSRSLGITLEVLDASQDQAREVEELKRMIGRAGAQRVADGSTILLDTGQTTHYLAAALRGRQNLTVITNSLNVLDELADEPGITLVSTGGVLRPGSRAFVGAGAEASLQDLRADTAFVSGTGFTLGFGLSTTSMPEAAVKRAMLQAARENFLLADHTKIGTESLVKVAPADSIQGLITDPGISPHDRLAFTQHGIQVTIAGETAKEVIGK